MDQAISIESASIGIASNSRRKPESLARLKQAARKLFVERGYDATRPQDIAREAGLGHGTFYLHYPDKRACFMAFVEDARRELDVYLRQYRAGNQTFEQRIATTLRAICDYADSYPGVLRAAMSDSAMIDAGSDEPQPLLLQWGRDWAEMIRGAAGDGSAAPDYDADIIGQAIVGALHQTCREAHGSGRCRDALVANLTRFLTRALRPE